MQQAGPRAGNAPARLLLGAVLLASLCSAPRRSAAAAPPDVSLSSALGRPGSPVQIDMVLTTNGNSVGAAALDVQFDMRALAISECHPGAAAGAAEKEILGPSSFCSDHTTACSPQVPCSGQSCDTERIGVYGINRTQIPDGTIVTCTMTIAADATPGLYRLANTSACPPRNCERAVDPDGHDIAGTTGSDGFVDVLGNTPVGGRVATSTPTAPRTTAAPRITPTRTVPPRTSPSPAVSPPAGCRGDCNGDGTVTVDELLLMTEIAFGDQPASACPNGDSDRNQLITAYEIVAAARSVLQGCP